MWKRLIGMGFTVGMIAGCSDSATAPTPQVATISATTLPNPVTATVCSPGCTSGTVSYQFRVIGSLTISESAGLGGNVDSITSGGVVYSATDIAQRSGTVRVVAHGSLVFPLNFVYGLVDDPAARRAFNFPFTVAFTDDHGNHLTAIANWSAN